MADDLIPISDEQAKAIQEVAKLGGEALETLQSLGGFLREVFGGVPKNLISLLGGDYLEYRRLLNLASLKVKYEERLKRLGITDTMPPRLTLALPILRAAADESQDTLQDLWASLLAAAMNPQTSTRVRLSFINVVKQFDPLDARILTYMGKMTKPTIAWPNHIAQNLSMGVDEAQVSIENLIRLGCLVNQAANSAINMPLTPFGRELLRACGD